MRGIQQDKKGKDSQGPAFRKISLDKSLIDRLEEKYIGRAKGHGYSSIANFVEDAIRRRVESLERDERLYTKE
jgi:hypothetical protein